MIPAELVDFLESGISILVGTRDAQLRPDCCQGIGARVENEHEITVFVAAQVLERQLPNLQDNGRAAVCFARAEDHHSIQVKGQVLEIEEATEADRPIIERYRRGLSQDLFIAGVPVRATLALAHWPARAVRVRVESIFVQTPGPGAGNAFAQAEGVSS